MDTKLHILISNLTKQINNSNENINEKYDDLNLIFNEHKTKSLSTYLDI